MQVEAGAQRRPPRRQPKVQTDAETSRQFFYFSIIRFIKHSGGKIEKRRQNVNYDFLIHQRKKNIWLKKNPTDFSFASFLPFSLLMENWTAKSYTNPTGVFFVCISAKQSRWPV